MRHAESFHLKNKKGLTQRGAFCDPLLRKSIAPTSAGYLLAVSTFGDDVNESLALLPVLLLALEVEVFSPPPRRPPDA